jgi:hypothetical protein
MEIAFVFEINVYINKSLKLALIVFTLTQVLIIKVEKVPYFSIYNAHLLYNAHPKLFQHSF